MAFRITCEGIDAATFYNDEKAYDYIRYALSKDDCNNVSIAVVTDDGAPVSQEAPGQPAATEIVPPVVQ